MEAMLLVMTKLQEAGYTEITEFYKATLISPDGNTVLVIDASAGIHNIDVTTIYAGDVVTSSFSDVRLKEDGEKVLSFLSLDS